MSWKDLSIPLKAELIRIGVKAGIGLKLLLSLYDELLSIEGAIKEELTIDNNRNVQLQDPSVYMEGLIKEAEDAYRKYSQSINDTIYNPSRDNPPFILRILNNDRRSVKDWLNENYNSTHKLSYALTPEGFVVYPDVLDINGLLHDFTDPKYNHGKWDALDSAIQRGDTLVFPTELKAREYTETYKTLYPEYFNSFNNGGYINKFALGGPKKRKKENSLAWRQAVYNGVDPRGAVGNLEDAIELYLKANTKYKRNDNTKNYNLDGSLGDYVTDAAWRKRLLLPYNEIYLPVWNGDTVSLPRELEMEIPIDTNLVKQRIEYVKQEALKDVKDFKFRLAIQDLRYKKTLNELLEALRYTYETGKPVGISEYHSNSINPEDVLSTFSYGKTPLNVLGRYNIRYDKDENKMYYSDEWDFNLFEWAVPGTPFRIRGAIPLPGDKKYGGYIFPKGVFENRFEEGGYEEKGQNLSLILPEQTVESPPVDRLDINNIAFKMDPEIIILGLEDLSKYGSMEEVLEEVYKKGFTVPKGNPENTYAARVNTYNAKTNNNDKDLRIKELKSKSETEVKEIQKDLADLGYYDFDLETGKNKHAIDILKRLQRKGYLSKKDIDGIIGPKTTEALLKMLIDEGYLSELNEFNNSNIDGIIGKRTRKAFKDYNRDYNIDGIVGPLTEKNYLESTGYKIVSAEGMQDQCAKWVSKQFDSNVGNSKLNGVFGNAWNMLYNIVDSGGEMVFNLYESPAFTDISTTEDIKSTVDNLLKSTDMLSLYSSLQLNDVVGIHVPTSSHFLDVLNTGTTYNSHVGIVTGFKDGIPLISHNINGKVRTEPINKLTGSFKGTPSVTAASRPKKFNSVQQPLIFDSTITSDLEIPEDRLNSLMNDYMDSLAQSKEVFKNIYPDVDMGFIEKASIGITKVETNYMNTKLSDLRKDLDLSALARSVAHWAKGTPEEVISQDLTKMKFSSLSSEYRRSIGLNSPEQLSEDPVVTGRAVFVLLCKYYDYFQRLAKENPDLGLTTEDIENATILSYNKGLGATHTLGFDANGVHDPEELEILRESSIPSARERGINSTNYKYLPILSEYFYNKEFPEGHLTYVGRVRESMLNIAKK